MEGNDPDVDGDTLLDAEDDQDNDDILNIYEMYDALARHQQRPAQERLQPLRARRATPAPARRYDPL